MPRDSRTADRAAHKGSPHPVLTGDGSYTLYLPEFGENMHSLSGAYEEALFKHVVPSGALHHHGMPLLVLDVGFGLGYNTLALMVSRAAQNAAGPMKVVALEKDRSLLPYMKTIVFNDLRDRYYSAIIEAYETGSGMIESTEIGVAYGDARDSVRVLADGCFHAVFFDPFSPARNPELWTTDFFIDINRVMADSAILTTYSSARRARRALIEAGFIIGRGPSVGGKREGTIAARSPVITPLEGEAIASLKADPRSAPYRDPGLRDDRASIITRRKEDIREKQGLAERG